MAKYQKVLNPKKRGRKKLLLADYFKEFTESEILQIDFMLNNSERLEDIVEVIQKKFNKKTHTSNQYLSKRLSLYKRNILQPKIFTQIQDVDVYKELLALKTKVDSMKEFTVLVLTQKKRLERALKLELIAGVSERYARQEVKLMADILEKLAKLQMETGILPRAPRVVSGEFEFDEQDPSKITYQVTESFMKALDDIETEYKDITDDLIQIPQG